MSKICAELMKAGDLEHKKGESHDDLVTRIVKTVGDLPDKQWAAISEPAQKWFNKAATAYNDKETLPDFPDAEKDEKKDDKKPDPKADPKAADKKPDEKKPEEKIGRAHV